LAWLGLAFGLHPRDEENPVIYMTDEKDRAIDPDSYIIDFFTDCSITYRLTLDWERGSYFECL